MLQKKLFKVMTLLLGVILAFSLIGCDILETKDPTGTKTDPIPLNPNTEGLTGTITADQQEVWYKFTVTSGSYVLTVRDNHYPNTENSPYTVDVKTSVTNSEFAYINDVYGTMMNGVDTDSDPDIILTNLAGTYYAKIQPYTEGDTGTFFIQLTRRASTGTQQDPITLIPGVTASGNITTLQSSIWYTFNVNGNYQLTIYDSYYNPVNPENNPYTLDVKTSVMSSIPNGFISDITGEIISGYDNGTSKPNIVMINLSGIYYVKVEAYYAPPTENPITGTFAITLATSNVTPPDIGTQGNPYIFPDGGGNYTGEITTTHQDVWYKFTANGSYKVTVLDSYYKPEDGSSSPYTVDVKTSVMDSDQKYLYDLNGRQVYELDTDSDPDMIFVNIYGPIFVKIQPYSAGSVGTFYVSATPYNITGTQTNPIILNVGSGQAGALTVVLPELWYKFTGSGGYKLTVSDVYYPGGSAYSIDVKTSVMNSSFAIINDIGGNPVSGVDANESNPDIFLIDLSGEYYVKIEPYYEEKPEGTFHIALSTFTAPTGDGTQGNPYTLIPGLQVTNSLTTAQQAIWYTFTAGGSYILDIYDSYYPENSNYTVDVVTTVMDASFGILTDKTGFTLDQVDITFSYTSIEFNFLSGVIYVKIEPYTPDNPDLSIGSFALRLTNTGVGAPPPLTKK